MKHQHLFSYVERMNFPYLRPLKFHSLTPLIYVLSSLSALLEPARSPLPSQKHTCYKVSPSQHRFTKLDLSYSSLDILMCFLFTISLQHRFTKPDLSYSYLHILMRFLFTISLKFPHSSLTPLLPFLHKLFFSHIFLICFLLP